MRSAHRESKYAVQVTRCDADASGERALATAMVGSPRAPARIKALFCCQFLALLVAALIERKVRTGMRQTAINNILL